jgi:lipooligosaccharide transport system permease protein
MSNNNPVLFPPFAKRISGVWLRHFHVYAKSLFSNSMPPFLEPLIFLAGIGLGMAGYLPKMSGMPYLTFLATGLPLTASMFVAASECSYGAYIRLEFDHVYEGMLSAPLSVFDILIGEILWAATLAMFFSIIVVLVVACFGLAPMPASLLTGIAGFLTGLMFAAISLLVTSFVPNINQFNFYFTAFLSPMFFLCGVVFPIDNLPRALQIVAEVFPLTHSVRLARGFDQMTFSPVMLWDLIFIVVFSNVVVLFAVKRLQARLIQ